MRFRTPDNGLEAPTAFQVEQIRAVSASRLLDRRGHIDASARHMLDETLRNALSLR
jgi:mRNA-degrading endonuclease toxin of MazEF toxin-antitoxin module